MPTLWITEFTGGLDSRKHPVLSTGGTLIRAVNGHIDRGGAFEQRAVFEKVHTAPANTIKGLASLDGFIVGLGQGDATASPTHDYQILDVRNAAGQAPDYFDEVTLFKQKVFATGVFADGSRVLFGGNLQPVTGVDAPTAPGPLLTQGQRVLVGDGGLLRLSVLGDGGNFTIQTPSNSETVPPGGGVFDMTTRSADLPRIRAVSRYNDLVAVFGKDTIFTWFVDEDPANCREVQILRNTGALAARSVTSYASSDVFYLGRYGVRSLRARDSSNSAASTDTGSPIDTLVIDQVNRLGVGAERSIGLLEPRDGRFWLIMRDRIFVFSYFTGSKISAWTVYEPGFVVDDAIVHRDRVFLLSGDDIYVYGSQPGQPYRYDEGVVAEAWTPYLDMGSPGREKRPVGVDAVATGEWQLWAGLNPNQLNAESQIGTITRQTYNAGSIGLSSAFNHISLRARSSKPVSATEPARFASVSVHYEVSGKEDD